MFEFIEQKDRDYVDVRGQVRPVGWRHQGRLDALFQILKAPTMTYASPSDFASTSHSARRPARVWRVYANPMLWTLQGWLAMFFIAAAYTKLSQPQDLLAILLPWTEAAPAVMVKAIGWGELALGLGVLAPLVSWRLGRPAMMLSAVGLTASALIMTGVHLIALEPGLAFTNVALATIGAGLLWGRTVEAGFKSAAAVR